MKANLCFQAVEGAGALKILKAKNLLTKSLEPGIWRGPLELQEFEVAARVGSAPCSIFIIAESGGIPASRRGKSSGE
jgi:hypothetical protein